MKLPAFGWPPRFMNQGIQAFVQWDPTGTILVKSPEIIGITVIGAGIYQIALTKEMDIAFAEAINSTGQTTTAFIVGGDKKLWQFESQHVTGPFNPVGMAVWFFCYPQSWIV